MMKTCEDAQEGIKGRIRARQALFPASGNPTTNFGKRHQIRPASALRPVSDRSHFVIETIRARKSRCPADEADAGGLDFTLRTLGSGVKYLLRLAKGRAWGSS